MENQFFVDSEYLSEKALEKKHRLETDPSSRKNHMEISARDGKDQIPGVRTGYGSGEKL